MVGDAVDEGYDRGCVTEYLVPFRNCWGNAVAESFFGTLKQELVFRLKLQSRATTRTAIFEYMEATTTLDAATPLWDS